MLVEEAENGALAMNKLKEISPDFILLDIMMPVMDGYEMIKKLKSQYYL